jgi:four helix bundle protein
MGIANGLGEGIMKNFRDLNVWQKSRSLNLRIYRITEGFPSKERYRLTDQMCRAAISIPSNIAEGCGRRSDLELAHFFTIAKGSASELECQLILANDLEYLNEIEFQEAQRHVEEIQKMLAAFIATLYSSSRR